MTVVTRSRRKELAAVENLQQSMDQLNISDEDGKNKENHPSTKINPKTKKTKVLDVKEEEDPVPISPDAASEEIVTAEEASPAPPQVNFYVLVANELCAKTPSPQMMKFISAMAAKKEVRPFLLEYGAPDKIAEFLQQGTVVDKNNKKASAKAFLEHFVQAVSPILHIARYDDKDPILKKLANKQGIKVIFQIQGILSKINSNKDKESMHAVSMGSLALVHLLNNRSAPRNYKVDLKVMGTLLKYLDQSHIKSHEHMMGPALVLLYYVRLDDAKKYHAELIKLDGLQRILPKCLYPKSRELPLDKEVMHSVLEILKEVIGHQDLLEPDLVKEKDWHSLCDYDKDNCCIASQCDQCVADREGHEKLIEVLIQIVYEFSVHFEEEPENLDIVEYALRSLQGLVKYSGENRCSFVKKKGLGALVRILEDNNDEPKLYYLQEDADSVLTTLIVERSKAQEKGFDW